MRGVVLTSTNDLTGLVTALNIVDLGLLKVVTGWPNWSKPQREIAAKAPALIVRSVTGDGIAPPDPNKLREELRDWYAARPDMYVEVGNEPNAIPGFRDDQIWQYRYGLNACITMIRDEYPQAKIISPGLLSGNQLDRWFAVCCEVFSRCDYIGLHAYEWHNFTPPGTYQLKTALATMRRHCPARPAMITELGINDTATSAETKARRYRATIATLPGFVAGTVCYHVCDAPSDNDQRAYALTIPALQYLK